ncbi:MAG: TetR/AcrR family transcriptional regulator [Pseudomonadota bacterium]|nr:TetR/AcrR family transcriptional regulator [Pseudomonadota bacterium]MEE3098562.1 TetR/AcrR family transcriptional regulator [Pseudomonadota bacterium]
MQEPDPNAPGTASPQDGADPAEPERKPPGRPRDPTLEGRVHDAAMRLYAEQGWSGFSIERIAREAGVGKAAIYARWPTKQALLAATFDLRWEPMKDLDTGSLRGDLAAWVALSMARFGDNGSGMVMNAQVDALRHPEFREIIAPFQATAGRRMRKIFHRARDRGELAADIDLDLAVLMVIGPTTQRHARIEATPHEMTSEETARFCDDLVALLMRAFAPR